MPKKEIQRLKLPVWNTMAQNAEFVDLNLLKNMENSLKTKSMFIM